uniref:Uncharacterized protein n=1 Tax=Xiphophorus maculatus TaxID=8083 RepID=A0A3B5QGB7_XIPMA
YRRSRYLLCDSGHSFHFYLFTAVFLSSCPLFVFTWGDGDFGKLGHGNSERQRRPKQIEVVPSLEGLFIEDVAVGCEHVLALSSTGDIYTWGCNSEGQVPSVFCCFVLCFKCIMEYFIV